MAVGYDDFIFFNEQLASLADAGVALDKGLREIARDIRGGRLRRVVNRIADKLEQGVPLDQAVAAHESSLPVLYSRVIRAGIRSGQLSAALLNLSQHLRFIAQARRIVFEALSYPITVLFIALALFSLIMQWLIPQFEEIILDFNATVPLFSRCVFAFARAYPWLLMGVGIAAAAIIVLWSGLRTTTRGRRFRERLLLAVPVVGRLVRVSLVARFFRSVSLSVASGIPLPETLRMASQATGSPGLTRDADRVAERIELGESAARAGEAARLLPPVFGYVVDTAAARNTLPQATAELAKAYEMRAAHYQSLLRTWLVPLAVIFVAVSVGFCVVAMFWPLARLIQSVSV